jgi:hypothetical protein
MKTEDFPPLCDHLSFCLLYQNHQMSVQVLTYACYFVWKALVIKLFENLLLACFCCLAPTLWCLVTECDYEHQAWEKTLRLT